MYNSHILTVNKISPKLRNQLPSQMNTFQDIRGGEDDGTVGIGEVSTWSVTLTDKELAEYQNPKTQPSNLIDVEENALAHADMPGLRTYSRVSDPIFRYPFPELKEYVFHHSRPALDWLQEHRYSWVKAPRVAILDTGIDQWFPLTRWVVDGASFIGGEPWNKTTHFHGMHCAGLAYRHGIGQRLLIGKVLSNAGSGAIDGIVSGIYWAVDSGADILSLSLSGPGSSSTAYQNAVNYATSRNRSVWAAMGNEGVYERRIPASLPGVQAVIALGGVYNSHRKAYFSNFGEWAFASAHGVDMLSASTRGMLTRASGTSMATPWCAGEDSMLVARFGRNSARKQAFQNGGHSLSIPRIRQGQIGKICIHEATKWLLQNG